MKSWLSLFTLVQRNSNETFEVLLAVVCLCVCVSEKETDCVRRGNER